MYEGRQISRLVDFIEFIADPDNLTIDDRSTEVLVRNYGRLEQRFTAAMTRLFHCGFSR